MASQRNVFLIGAGFIGGEILDLLVAQGYNVTALVRREAQAAELKTLGVATVLGTLEDGDLLEQQVSKSDIVIHSATADDLPSVEAVIKGLKKSVADGKTPIYIHTSGASELSDDSEGAYKSDKVFRDDHPEDVDSLPDDAPHREVDLAILKARKELGNKAKIAIVLPPIIYGVGSRGQRLSIQLPTLTRFAIKHGYAGQIGKGLSTWSQVHIADLARGYVTILQWLETHNPESIYENPYFFVENGEQLSWGECSAEIGRALHAAGRIESPEPREIPKELYGDLFGVYTRRVVGSNARNEANRLRALGWKPREKPTKASISEDEIPLILKETGPFKGYTAAVASGSA
ncbi:Nn.00g096550.m01.CDS01 [Neocucurbitaria sp. VM-36]